MDCDITVRWDNWLSVLQGFKMHNLLCKIVWCTRINYLHGCQYSIQISIEENLWVIKNMLLLVNFHLPLIQSVVISVLMSIRETGGDWTDGMHGRGDPILKGEKDPKTGYQVKIPERDVGPSSTQVIMWCLPYMYCIDQFDCMWVWSTKVDMVCFSPMGCGV